MRLAAVTVVPLALLGSLEIGLRVAGYGYDPSFLQPAPGGYFTSNQRYGERFFPRELARSPTPFRVERVKPPGTIRIVILGGSAAMGIPDTAYSLGRVLQAMLDEMFPSTRIEVVNAAMTAINSHVVRDIASECRDLEPDLYLVYMGNNEVVGPFGPGTVLSGLSRSRTLVRLSVWVRRFRVGQLIDRLVARIGAAGPATWRGMEMFVGHTVAERDPRLDATYDSFASNLEDILSTARRAGAGVVISTVASNLADCPPFASLHRAGLAAGDLGKWQDAFNRGEALLRGGEPEGAAAAFEEALAIDDEPASLHYRLAQSALALGRTEDARREFTRARDLDALRFRADSRINEVIRRIAGRFAAENVHLVDAERVLADAPESPRGILGDGLFWEHVHYRVIGEYRLAAALLPAIRDALGDRQAASTSAPAPGPAEVDRRLGLNECERFRMAYEMHGMMLRPPFTGQLDHQQRSARRAAELTELWDEAVAERKDCLAEQRSAVEAHPDDLDLRTKLASRMDRQGVPGAAAQEWQWLVERLPDNEEFRTRLGFSLLDAGRAEQGLRELRRVVDEQPSSAQIWSNLGSALKQTGDLDGAVRAFRSALRRNPRLGEAYLGLAAVELARGRLQSAIELEREAIAHDPGFGEAYNALGYLLEQAGQAGEAEAEYRKAVEVAPQLVAGWNNLGVLLERGGRIAEAEACFRRTLSVEPGHALAGFNLGDLLLQHGRPAEAVGAYDRALLSDSSNLQGRINLAVALQIVGRTDRAVSRYREVLIRDPESLAALQGLAWILATSDEASLRDPEEALELVRRAREAGAADSADLLETEGLALAASGRRDEAGQVFDRAAAAADAAGKREDAERLRRRRATLGGR